MSISYLVDRDQRLRSILCSPHSKATLEELPLVNAGGIIRESILLERESRKLVGVKSNFQYSFHNEALVSQARGETELIESRIRAGELPKQQDYRRRRERVVASDPRINASSPWTLSEDRKYLFHPGFASRAPATVNLQCAGVSVELLCSPWAGKARFWIDGRPMLVVDCHAPFESYAKEFVLADDLEFGPHSLEIEPLGEANSEAKGAQIRVISCTFLTDAWEIDQPERPAGQNAKPFPKKFLELWGAQSAEAVVFDVGGGQRQVEDPRYINFEYEVSAWPDVFGDGHALPFRDNSADVILSQAVLEHVRNPHVAAAELMRVLKSGGMLYAETPLCSQAIYVLFTSSTQQCEARRNYSVPLKLWKWTGLAG